MQILRNLPNTNFHSVNLNSVLKTVIMFTLYLLGILITYNTLPFLAINLSIAEPNLFPKLTNTTVISAEQLANDFSSLKKLVQILNLKPTYIAGPDISQSGSEYLKE